MCGEVSMDGCGGSAVCKATGSTTESYGVAGSTYDFIPEGQNIKMKYTGNTACGKGLLYLYF